jgi:hypothetical protein
VHRFELVGQKTLQMQRGMKNGQKIIGNLSAKAQETRDTAVFSLRFSARSASLR